MDYKEIFDELNSLVEDKEILSESSINRVIKELQSSDICFISAFKEKEWIRQHYPTENTSDNRAVKKINRERNTDLLKNLTAKGYYPTKVDGIYFDVDTGMKDVEESFIVVDKQHKKEDFIDEMKSLMNKYNQQSILVVYTGNKKHTYFFSNGSEKTFDKPLKLGRDANARTLINGRPVVASNPYDEFKVAQIRYDGQRENYANAGEHFED